MVNEVLSGAAYRFGFAFCTPVLQCPAARQAASRVVRGEGSREPKARVSWPIPGDRRINPIRATRRA
jgi:hypothetical protein